MIHFDEGLPEPIIPATYPRAHGFKAASEKGVSFLTVVYGEGLETTTGDINRVLTAGLGLHDGGPRHKSKKEFATQYSYCFPDDHDYILSQKDVYIYSVKEEGKARFAKARQSHFTTHAFRFAEVCCTAEPPKNTQALVYRTAVPEWGSFDSSNILINGGYELVKNAMVSNMLVSAYLRALGSAIIQANQVQSLLPRVFNPTALIARNCLMAGIWLPTVLQRCTCLTWLPSTRRPSTIG